MSASHWIVAGVVAIGLACSAPAFADHEKGHNGGGSGGKWRHGKEGCHKMSPEKRELLHGTMKKVHEKNADLRAQMKDRHAALDKVLGAKKFDRDAFLKVYEELAALQSQKQRNMAEAFADVAPKLSADERKKCAMFLAGGMHHGMRGRHMGPGGHHGKWRGGHGHGWGHGKGDGKWERPAPPPEGASDAPAPAPQADRPSSPGEWNGKVND